MVQPVVAAVEERSGLAALYCFCFGKTKEDRTIVAVLGVVAAAAVVAAAVVDARAADGPALSGWGDVDWTTLVARWTSGFDLNSSR